MKTIKIFAWPDGEWVAELDYSPELYQHKGKEVFELEVPSTWQQFEITDAVSHWKRTGELPMPKELEVTETLEYLAESDHVRVIINPTGQVACEVYAVKDTGYKAYSIAKEMQNRHYKDIKDYVASLNVQIKLTKGIVL